MGAKWETEGKAPGLVGQDLEQSAGDRGEVARFRSQSLEPRFQKAQGVIERVVHDPHASGASGQGGEALGLGFKLEQGAGVEGRTAGEIPGGDGLVEKIEQLLVIGCGQSRVIASREPTPLGGCSHEYTLRTEFNPGLLS